LDLIKKDVERMKIKTNSKSNNHEEEIEQLKTQIKHLIHMQVNKNTTKQTIHEDFIGIPVKR